MSMKLILSLIMCFFAVAMIQAEPSHPPMRVTPTRTDRPLGAGPAYFVDAQSGTDSAAGTAEKPWKSINFAMTKLQPGDTLCLKGGTFFERIYVGLRGTLEKPITIRSAPGEIATIDAGIADFSQSPKTHWEPNPNGMPGEYRSTKNYPNARDLIGSFGDSMIGLQTYYHAIDLRSTSEVIDWENWNDTANSDYKPLYCGPGLWYDARDGRVYCRLAHTNLPAPMPNYRGPTDPRQVPLVIAPFNAVALHLDGAEHVQLQDITIRGGGYTTAVLDHAKNIEMDNVTIWCGTYGIRATRTVGFKFLNSALYGNAAPWTFRTDTSKRDYPGRPHRNITRLNTHSLLELDGGRESSVFATPQNDHWEFANSEFTDAHDALYLGGIACKFHHNLIENMQDDGIYLSPMYFRHKLDKSEPEIHIYQNMIRQVLTPFAFGGTETVNRDRVFIYRNIVDLRQPIATQRPSVKTQKVGYSGGKPMGDHGSPPWARMNIYQNTFVISEPVRDVAMATTGSTKAGVSRNVFNNIYLHFTKLPGYLPPVAANGAVEDGNLFWSPGADEKLTAGLFTRYRASAEFADSKKLYADGSSSHSLVKDPKFVKAEAVPTVANDYRLAEGSTAIGTGVPIPVEWPDPLRKADTKPDIGALPAGTSMFQAGRPKAK